MDELRQLANPANVEGQRRFAIVGGEQLGVSVLDIRRLARGVRDHDLAQRLWESNVHEAQLLAMLVDDPRQVTKDQMNRWVNDFESWDICDQATNNLFIYADGILELVPQWALREEEFVRRAAFSSMAAIALHDRYYTDEVVVFFCL